MTSPARAQTKRPGRPGRRYPSDLDDAERAVIGPLLPGPCRRGRPLVHARRVIVDAIFNATRAGCAWRYLPNDFPPGAPSTATSRAGATTASWPGCTTGYATRPGPPPAAAVIDSQPVRAADTAPRGSRGWDNAKKDDGRKRHIAVDATGLVLAVVITAASVQDRDAARPKLWNLSRCCTPVRLAWADAGSADKLATWAASLKIELEIVRKRDAHAFEVLPRRWVVERTLAWITAHRRRARDTNGCPKATRP
jgi:transposase